MSLSLRRLEQTQTDVFANQNPIKELFSMSSVDNKEFEDGCRSPVPTVFLGILRAWTSTTSRHTLSTEKLQLKEVRSLHRGKPYRSDLSVSMVIRFVSHANLLHLPSHNSLPGHVEAPSSTALLEQGDEFVIQVIAEARYFDDRHLHTLSCRLEWECSDH